MRLLNVHSYKFESYDDLKTTPPYVILSHRCGSEEVLFEDIQERPYEKEIQDLHRKLEDMSQRVEILSQQLRTGGSILADKVQGGVASQPDGSIVVQQVSVDEALGFSYVWIDTCCINKDSLVEVSESINSMYSWYGRAHICIAYLSDVSTQNAAAEFEESQWFQRGWTLQELIVPNDVRFYSKDWVFLGIRSVLASKIARKSSIDEKVLYECGRDSMSEFSVAARLSWATKRTTTKVEDRAYSLIGLFGINMPILYGEGEVASFHRLQAEIYKAVPDQSIFAWDFSPAELLRMSKHNHSVSLFASHVDCFKGTSSIVSGHDHVSKLYLNNPLASRYLKFSNGTRVMLLIQSYLADYIAYLGCRTRESTRILAIPVRQTEPGNFRRLTEYVLSFEEAIFLNMRNFSMVEAFISPTVQKLSDSQFTQFSVRMPFLLNDGQLLESGFTRITQASGLFQCEEILAKVPESTTKQAFELYLHNINLTTSVTSSGMIELSIYGDEISNGDLVYLNKNTETIFIIKLRLGDPDLDRRLKTTDYRSPGVVVGFLQPTEEINVWELGISVLHHRVVANEWRISMYLNERPRSGKELVLKAFPLGSLELNQEH